MSGFFFDDYVGTCIRPSRRGRDALGGHSHRRSQPPTARVPAQWSTAGTLPDSPAGTVEDMGLSKADLAQLTASYDANMAALQAEVLSRGKFAWQ